MSQKYDMIGKMWVHYADRYFGELKVDGGLIYSASIGGWWTHMLRT